jgi:hypothetical protein
MKNLIHLTAIAALAASGLSNAQTAAYSKPSGYVTQDLSQGFNLLGLTLLNSPAASGLFETINASSLVDDQLSFTPISGRKYVLEITSGAITGAIFEVEASGISGTTITPVTTSPTTDLTTLGITTSDTYAVRIAPTLEEIFTTTPLASGGVLVPGLSSLNADVIWVPISPGVYNRYFLHSSGQFRIDGTTTAAPNVPIIYGDAFFVQKKNSSAASITLTGEVKTNSSITVLAQGFNLVNTVVPAGATLANVGLEDDLTPGLSPLNADILWVQTSSLNYDQYFLRSGNWRSVAAPTVDLTSQQTEAISLSGAVLIQRKSATPVTVDITVPSSYNDL